MKDKLEGKIVTEFVTLRPKEYSYLTDDDNIKKLKKQKKIVIKRILKFNEYRNCLCKNETTQKSQQRFKTE